MKNPQLRQLERQLRELGLEPEYTALLRFLDERHSAMTVEEAWLALLLQKAMSEGHVCLEKARVGERIDALFSDRHSSPPDADALAQAFDQAGMTVEESEAETRPGPLVRVGDRLYFHRYWRNETRIAETLRALTGEPQNLDAALGAQIDDLFPQRNEVDFQKLAAIVALRHRLAIVSGGPGTGKTWVVSRVLALLLRQNPELRIALAAPTGKAAARLSQAIDDSRPQLGLDAETLARIPAKALTLHRLLRIHPMSGRPRHDAARPLELDVLVLDEASMIDQSLMALVCAALPDSARLILLGDKDQLASVEAGNVFADLCGGLKRSEASAAQQQWLEQQFALRLPRHQGGYTLADQVVVLEKSRRFDPESGIGLLARQINDGDADGCIQTLRAEATEEQGLDWTVTDPDEAVDYGWLADTVYGEMIEAEDVEQAFARFSRLRVLAGVWEGPLGVHRINDDIEQRLRQKAGLPATTRYYHGQPLMMASNVYAYGIHNGDVGIVWHDEDSGELRLWVETAGGYQPLSLSQLPRHHSAYAMTLHKSQGSEFDEVLIVLPQAESPLMSRELLYTGVTRARSRVRIRGSEAALRAAIGRRIERMSGLRDRLTDGKGLP